MKVLLILGICVSSVATFAMSDADTIADIQACTTQAKVAVVTMKDQSVRIRTVSPLGHPRLWSLEKDFTKNSDGSYENGFLKAEVANGKIISVSIKNLTSAFNCSSVE